tara:strand:- start:1104 stop:1256 length:153 start_codon:yes stop_codon:yes gene_type:complete
MKDVIIIYYKCYLNGVCQEKNISKILEIEVGNGYGLAYLPNQIDANAIGI